METTENANKTLFWVRLTGICSLLVMICALVITINFVSYQPEVKGLLRRFNTVAAELEAGSRELTKTLRSLNDQGLAEMYETLDSIQKIDFERLNESIDSLYRVINPLAGLFSR
ncbi:MAG: hypothetical protein Q4C63_04175 [Eubacteriales bacterium]|nr:hypothetical protein [Eubacteriales bacterium]